MTDSEHCFYLPIPIIARTLVHSIIIIIKDGVMCNKEVGLILFVIYIVLCKVADGRIL